MRIYKATSPNGQIIERTCATTYAYAVLVKNKDTGRWLASWSITYEDAEKQAQQNVRFCPWAEEVVIVPAVAA